MVRGARIYAELCGIGRSSDAHHMVGGTRPRQQPPSRRRSNPSLTPATLVRPRSARPIRTRTAAASWCGTRGNAAVHTAGLCCAQRVVDRGLQVAMEAALAAAGAAPTDLQHVNAHATSTPRGDEIELQALSRLCSSAVPASVSVCSTKGATGHTLGASGAIEAVFTVLAMEHSVVPPTLNLTELCEVAPALDVRATAVRRAISLAMSNSFGFGGINTSLVFRKHAAPRL